MMAIHQRFLILKKIKTKFQESQIKAMDLVRKLNIKKTELIEIVHALSGNDKTDLQLKIVYVRDNNTWKFLIGTCKPYAGKDEESCIEYNNYAFVCKIISQDSYSDFIQKLYDDGYETGKNFPRIKLEENANWNQEYLIPSNRTPNKLPARQLSASIEKDVRFQESQLIGFNQDFHPSAQKIIESFIGLEIFYGDQDARKGNLVVEVADYRGRIEINNGILRMQANTNDFCIVGQSALHGQIKLNGNNKLNINQTDTEDLELWMLKNDGEIIDFRSASKHTNRKKRSETTENYLSIIRRGESQHTELKPYITIDKENKSKIDELKRSVCALSNHEGGQIFIGVNDDLDIIGVCDQRFYKDYPGPQEEGTTQYINNIRKLLRESLHHNQCFEIETLSVATKSVIIILVQQADSINFIVSDKQAYIRRGSSNARMSPEEIQLKANNTYSTRKAGNFL